MGKRELMSSFNAAATTGVSSGAEDTLSVHVGMRKGDWICPECGGWVWSKKPACESDKCQHRRQTEAASKAEYEKIIERVRNTARHEASVFYTTPVATERAVIIGELRSGDQAEFKRARVRDRTHQREILQGQRPVWKDGTCSWEFTQQEPSSGLDTAVMSTTPVWGDV